MVLSLVLIGREEIPIAVETFKCGLTSSLISQIEKHVETLLDGLSLIWAFFLIDVEALFHFAYTPYS